MKHSKRYQNLQSNIDKSKIYNLDEALELVKKNASAKFDEAVEVHIKLGIDSKKSDQQVRSSVVLPYGTGKKKRVIAFVNAEKVKDAEKAGADLIGTEELISKIKKEGQCDFDVAIAVPEMMKKLAPIAKILGPKGLMPSPKSGTVTENVSKAVKELKGGKIEFRSDKFGNIHLSIGKVSFEFEKLKENFKSLLNALKEAKPEGIKGNFIKGVTISSTMGLGVRVKV